jgi:chromatin segregation and condensation protein Rec8/ScpA/Scc1 (kleisin family)
MILEEERAKARAELERARKTKVSGMMHSENLEEEIAATWIRILELAHKGESPATPLSLDSLHNGTRDDYLTVFIAALFLAFNQRIVLSQPDLPRGPIMLQLTPEAQEGNLPPMPAPVVVPVPAPKARTRGSKRKAKRGSAGAKGSRQAPPSA